MLINHLEAEQVAWLRRLRWVFPLELILTGVCCVAVLVLLALGVVAGHHIEALMVGGSHTVALAAVIILASRRTSSQWLALVALSVLNYGLAMLNAFPGWQLIAWAYAALGVISGVWAMVGHSRMRRRWREILHYRARDEFKWLLIEAPLALRLRFARLIAGSRAADSHSRDVPRPPRGA